MAARMPSRPTDAVARPGKSGADQARAVVAALAATIPVLTLTVGPVLAAHLSYPLTGRPWPDTPGLVADLLTVWSHPADPTAGWPDDDGGPGPALVWAVTGILLLAALLLAGGLVAGRARIRRAPAGLATLAQEDRTLTVTALRRQATTLRPRLAATTTGPLSPTELGIRLGRSTGTGTVLWRPIETSTIVTGLSGSGKTTSVIIPAVLDFPARQLISTTKTDIIAATWQTATDRGGLRVFDPLNLTGDVFQALQWTPIAGCADPDIADNRTKVLTYRPPGPDPNAEFRADGQRVVRALLHAAALADHRISDMMRWVYNPLDERPEQIIRTAVGGYDLFADELAAVRKSPDKQREGSYLSVRGAFDGLSSPRVLHRIDSRPSQAMDTTAWLATGTHTLYLLTHRTQVPGATKVVSLFIADILEAARLHAAASTGSRLDPPLPIVADESLNTCRLNDWETVLSDSRGWGTSVTMVAQSRAMIRGAYGRDEGDAIWSAAGMRILVGGGDGGTDTKELADAFGRHDITTYTRDLTGTGGSRTTRREDTRTTADLRNLPPGRAIILAAQTPPIDLELQPWWHRPDHPQITAAWKRYEQARADHHHLGTATPTTS